jgi:anti-sigma B factor antagonist
MSNLTIRQRRTGPVVILTIDGKITLGAGSTALRVAVTDLLEGGSKRILLDLAEVSSLDSSGLGELVSAYARAHRFGGELKLLNLSPRVFGLLEMTKLVTIFEIFETEPDALRSFASSRAAHATL